MAYNYLIGLFHN